MQYQVLLFLENQSIDLYVGRVSHRKEQMQVLTLPAQAQLLSQGLLHAPALDQGFTQHTHAPASLYASFPQVLC